MASTILGSTSAIANSELAQITLSIDATLSPTFSDLMNRAEALAESEINQRFQADSTITELQITVMGERNGQSVYLLSSRISRNSWSMGANADQSTQYFAMSSALLGYRNSDPISTRVAQSRPVTVSRIAEPQAYPSDTLEEARLSGRISENEYWQLVDALD